MNADVNVLFFFFLPLIIIVMIFRYLFPRFGNAADLSVQMCKPVFVKSFTKQALLKILRNICVLYIYAVAVRSLDTPSGSSGQY